MKYEKQLSKKNVSDALVKKRKHVIAKQKTVKKMSKKDKSETCSYQSDNKKLCMGCHMTWDEDAELNTGFIWIQCKHCNGWIHKDCLPDDVANCVTEHSPFVCPECEQFGCYMIKHFGLLLYNVQVYCTVYCTVLYII